MPKLNFNPRFPRGKRLRQPSEHPGDLSISIHASREGSDVNELITTINLDTFQSTLPAREATRAFSPSDKPLCHFNPRFPRGKRPLMD